MPGEGKAMSGRKPDYLGDDFLLTNALGRALYHDHAASLPIIDYHCHIDPADIADDRRFADLAELWVCKDPYKWRAMRMNGIPERLITGDASNLDKFNAWAATVRYAIGNPLFHWTGLELKRYFGIDDLLGADTAGAVWARCNARLAEPGFSARGLLQRSRVEVLCTSDDLLDSLDAHRRCREAGIGLRMLPSLRGDSMVAVETGGFAIFCRSLGEEAGIAIDSLAAFKAAIRKRLDVFESLGCRVADHGLDEAAFAPVDDGSAARLFERRLQDGELSAAEQLQLKSALMLFAGAEYHRRGWIMLLHIGAQRVTSSRLRRLAGPAGGYAAIGRSADIAAIARFLDHLEGDGVLPRTVLFTLNPSDTDMFASLVGSFAEDGVPGKIQFGPAWWYNDNRDGIVRQLRALGNLGLLGRHIGMTTDSRSLLSYSRHEYYRRIVCNLIGEWVEAGELPNEPELLSGFIVDICYGNAKRWLEAGRGDLDG
jgi:glucuronate isomerase